MALLSFHAYDLPADGFLPAVQKQSKIKFRRIRWNPAEIFSTRWDCS